ncbi:GNAT family N-acetyltransferase [Sinorhizobium meliloti]|nr:GNAT family N-acetyltransferase [Sinorhizobium meliloti]
MTPHAPDIAGSPGHTVSMEDNQGPEDRVEMSLISLEEGNALRDLVLRSPNKTWHDLHKGTSWHFHVGAFIAKDLVATASFALDSPMTLVASSGARSVWRLRAMATHPNYQGKGIGRRVVDFGLQEVTRRGGGVVWCEGRVSAISFYEHCGFHSLGRVFHNPTTGPHVALVKPLV